MARTGSIRRVAAAIAARSADHAAITSPVPINGGGPALTDIFTVLFWETIFGLIFLVAGLFMHAWNQDRQQRGGSAR